MENLLGLEEDNTHQDQRVAGEVVPPPTAGNLLHPAKVHQDADKGQEPSILIATEGQVLGVLDPHAADHIDVALDAGHPLLQPDDWSSGIDHRDSTFEPLSPPEDVTNLPGPELVSLDSNLHIE